MTDYVVMPGDNLSKIARKSGTTVDQVLKNNPNLRGNPGLIKVGQVIKLPSGTTSDANANTAKPKIHGRPMFLPRCLPSGFEGPCRDPLMLDVNGHSRHASITDKVTGNLAQGDMHQINGVIIHQTGASSAQSTLNYYSNPKANGAHFLVAKDGKIYQTASLYKKTWHVGRLRSRCVAQGQCPPVPTKSRTMAQEKPST